MSDYKMRLIEGMRQGRMISFSDIRTALSEIERLELEVDRLTVKTVPVTEEIPDE